MKQIINVYCDESCHLENDQQPIMVLGAVWCLLEKSPEIASRLQEIKQKHGMKRDFEVKWTKVSGSKVGFYLDLIDYFFDDDDLHFRALIAAKDGLDHERFHQSHDDWYYKMYFDMLKVLISPDFNYRLYLDIKDSRGSTKMVNLHQVLSNNMYDFSRSIIERVQIIRSHESVIMQLADLLLGAVSYVNRDLSGNKGKEQIVERIRTRSGYSLKRTTLYRENKMNLFRWSPSGV